ncbi:MAG: hypothetical protein QXX08_01985 [Candidatus Bathyarchaeia archaeon]
MTEESKNKKPISPEKLLIDNPTDFQFHAAYVAYSDTYDKTVDPEIRKKLNQSILALQQNQIDFQTFYRNISQYRSIGSFQHNVTKFFIKTQKKQEWRRETQKRERNKRYGR